MAMAVAQRHGYGGGSTAEGDGMTEEAGRYLCATAFAVAGALAAWTAWACHRARKHGAPAADVVVWAVLALMYDLLALTKLDRVGGWVLAIGAWLRLEARQYQVYDGRRPLQIVASLAVSAAVAILLVVGIVSLWSHLRRHRTAIGFSGLALGFGAIRFISLHEVDAWNAALPWVRVVVELTASVGAASVALARLGQLRAKDHPAGAGSP
jgi:hypothetical protein